MIKLESLKKVVNSKSTKSKKSYTEYYTLFATKNFFKIKYKSNLIVSFVMKKKLVMQ